MKKDKIRAIAITGMITAVAFLITFVFRFKVSFLTFDFKDAFIALLALMYGPLYGVASAAIVALLEFLTVSDTGVYGLIMNFLASGTFALVCGIIYKYKRTFSGAILSLVFAAISVVAVMVTANIFITPFYMGVPRSTVIPMIVPLLLPFNIAKTVMNASSTLLLYKPVTSALKKMNILPKGEGTKNSLRSVILAVVAILIIVLTVLFLTLKLNGVFQVF
ncbi:MAG: ECF transporter S component [Clostridia bacterium]|nr:ECF transporter S component [Clostridia bacterium]